ncbi:MAG TPA: dual specificity protein phosphatase family protein [Anaeromyxobacteraceae bacterium]|nr:dual specificity protein phosphatase family protein [Anaeromyxobacteraceae bacterium]
MSPGPGAPPRRVARPGGEAQRFEVNGRDLDFHWIAPRLALGSAFPASAARALARTHGIARVIDVRREACDDATLLQSHGISLLHLPTDDCCAIAAPMIREGVRFAVEGLDRGERVLVHCQWGIGRSTLLALCVLVARGDDPLAAICRAKDARPRVSPSPEQLEAFVAFAQRWRAEHGLPWEVPSVEVLGAVAWRHLRPDGEVSRESARASATRSPRTGP